MMQYVEELDDLRLQLLATRATADESAQSARSAQSECSVLVKELEEKNYSLKEHEARVNRLGEQLDLLQKDLEARESSQMHLKDEVARIEHEITQALSKAGANKDCELRKILEDVSPKNFKKMNKLLTVKDEEIGKLRDEIRVMSAHWKLKSEELESQVCSLYTSLIYCMICNADGTFTGQLEKRRRVDQEMKKKVLKLEFCLQEARAQTRKLQRVKC